MMESMKRVDVLKGIEQILVQKAYETGHISHRTDGDWQKTNNGWVRVKGSPAQSTGYAPTEDEEEAEARNVLGISPREKLPEDYGNEEYGEITEEDLIEDKQGNNDESYGDDEVDYTHAKDIDYSKYDDDIKSIEFRENDDGEFEPHDDDYFRVADKIYEQTDREDISDEEADQLYDGIVDRVIERAYELRNGVQKSAVRDMRSTLTTKNMGF